MSSRLLTSARCLLLNISRTPLLRTLATVSETTPPSASASTSKSNEPEHEWQTRPPRKLTARERAIPGRVKLDAETPEGHLRPHLDIKVNPNHGLYGFFRQAVDEVTGVSSYETLTPKHKTNDYSGRSWLASELRRKSFKDLHTLWYVLARERNILATQEHEARRMEIDDRSFTSVNQRDRRCKKSMARIKQVLNERRLAYDQAVKLHQDGVTPEQLAAAEEARLDDTITLRNDVGMLEPEQESEVVRRESATPASDKPIMQ
ncbi:54S ribosomal protein L4 mitochondrial [Ceratobasidium sp. 428]|nr:54S ribosomal protein L4 mitochondrial [Ceratobasidium sp. 428]